MPRGLPPGLTINPSTGVVSGDPRTAGEYTFVVQAMDARGSVARSEQTVEIFQVALSASLPDGYRTAPYSGTITASGGASPYTFALAVGSSLPAGLSLSSSGVISGNVDALADTATFTVVATGSAGATGQQAFTITVYAQPIILTALSNPTEGAAYSDTLTVTGGKAPFTLTASSGLPSGLSAALSGTTITVSGTPAAGTAAASPHSISLTVEDANAQVAGFTQDLTVDGVADPFIGDVIALFHFDGSDGSTTMTDEVGVASWTVQGDAQIDTAQSKFGGSSVLFDGVKSTTADRIFASNSTGYFTMGSANWTVEAWVRLNTMPPDASNPYTVYAVGQTPAPKYFSLRCRITNTGALYVLADNVNGETGGVIYTGTAGLVTAGAWHHVAWVRDGGTIRLFVNGAEAGSVAISGSIYGAATQSANIGIDPSQNTVGNQTVFNGWIDELRVTKGAARYTAAFTPPTDPFPNP